MVGGPPDAFRRAEPILNKDMSQSLRYIGPAGEAAKVKALVNMVMNINTAGLAEGLALGHALGLDLTMLREGSPRRALPRASLRPTAKTCRSGSTSVTSRLVMPPKTRESLCGSQRNRG